MYVIVSLVLLCTVCMFAGLRIKLEILLVSAETVLPMGDQKWAKDIIWMPGPLFDEVLKVSLRSKLRFSNVIFLLANYIMNNL